MEAYLDNSATTRVFPEVGELVMRAMAEDYGNPSSMHRKGVEAEKYIKEATAGLAKLLKVQDKELFYTSGGTESDNWALIGTAMANRREGDHIIVTDMEHPAVSAPADYLEKQGFSVTRLPVDRQGRVDPGTLAEAVTDRTILASVMYVNNEIGSVQDIAALAECVHRKNPRTYFHTDAIQAFGKYRIYPKRQGIDLLSASSHKIHGPKGVGLLYVDSRVKIVPVIHGGGQQQGMRSGTDNVPGVAGFGLAARLSYEEFEAKREHFYKLKKRLTEGLLAMENVVIHGMAPEEGAPHIVSAAFPGVRSEVLLHSLEDRGVYVSAGSACSTHKRNASPTMRAIHAPRELSEATVRFSMAETTTQEEIEYCLETLGKLLGTLRRYKR
ncbi:MAG TPA: cysteine desulfurase NifS [Lachnospiraceae bacterium]|nr:cysteine desulfurase NifS [Lachnospiraceae bacterium]